MEKKRTSDAPIISLEGISKTFNPGTVNEKVLFEGFNLTVKEHDFISVVGSNGSGKTTMLNVICGSMPVDSGHILFRGKDISHMKEHQRAKFIGRVFQDPAKGTCAALSIFENMSLADNKGKAYNLTGGVNKRRLDDYRAMLETLGMGLENRMNQPVGGLSGGQRQALALLISTLTPIDLLILDEHTAALDPRSSETVMELTERVVREKQITTLMVTHNLRFAVGYGNRLIMMHQGGAVLDVAGEEKDACSIDDLLARFNEISIEVGN